MRKKTKPESEPDYVLETLDGKVIFEVRLTRKQKERIKEEAKAVSGTVLML